MLTTHFTVVDKKKLGQLGYQYKTEHLQSNTTIYGHVNEHMEEDISSTLRKIYDAFTSYNQSEGLPNDEAIRKYSKEIARIYRTCKKEQAHV